MYWERKYSTWPRSTPPILLCTQFIHWKRGTQNSYIYMCVCARMCPRVCDYTIEKYKKKMCYHQKNNSKVKTFERLENFKES